MKKYSIIFAIAVLGLLFTALGCRSLPAVQDTPAARPIEGIDISEIDTVPVGQEVTTGNIVWNITEVEDLGDQLTYQGFPGFLEAVEGKFIRVAFFIQNTGTEPKVFFDLRAIDDRGRVYSICLEGFSFFSPEEACVLQEMIPGAGNEYAAIFDVATDVNQLVLQVTDLNLPPQEVAYIDLGL